MQRFSSKVLRAQERRVKDSSGVQTKSRNSHLTLWLRWDQLRSAASWQRDNEHILTGYRPMSASYRQCIKSMMAVHNETVNIHSHLFGSILFLAIPLYLYNTLRQEYSTAGVADVAVFAIFFSGVAICFILSSTFHIINCHSPKVASFANQLDYLGIVLLMWGATIPTVYYGFWKDPYLRYVYWMVVSILSVICCVGSLHPRFRLPAFRVYRVRMYSALGFSAIAFIIHGLVLHGWELQNRRMALTHMLIMACFNLLGAACFALRIPERFQPGLFDIVGSSHQILHMMVIFAAFAHSMGLVRAFHTVHSE